MQSTATLFYLIPLQVNILIICGGMAFTFKKTLDKVSVWFFYIIAFDHFHNDVTRSGTPSSMPQDQIRSSHWSKKQRKTKSRSSSQSTTLPPTNLLRMPRFRSLFSTNLQLLIILECRLVMQLMKTAFQKAGWVWMLAPRAAICSRRQY